MQRKSTDYKRLVGTYKQTRDVPLRPLPELESDLSFARELLEDMRFNLAVSNGAIREHGMRMVFVSKDKNGHFHDIVKSNPALRIQQEAVRHMKTLSVEIALLEEQAATATKQKFDDEDFAELEFAV
jgi:hypothetical protein